MCADHLLSSVLVCVHFLDTAVSVCDGSFAWEKDAKPLLKEYVCVGHHNLLVNLINCEMLLQALFKSFSCLAKFKLRICLKVHTNFRFQHMKHHLCPSLN